MTDFKLDEFLPYMLAVLSNRVSAGFSKHYRKQYGISVNEWRVVAHLSQQSSVSVREICERIDMDKPKVSRAASRLEAAGYVAKKVNAADRRLVELSLTEKGRSMVAELTPKAQAYEAEIEALLNGADKEFRTHVNRLNEVLSRK